VTEVNVHVAKTHLSRLLARVEAGEEILICRAGQAVARLVPARRARGKRRPGRFVGKGRIADDFGAPLPPEVLAEFLK
jgi:prevent-host-death family protein